jgi:hypothetical protein
VNESAFPLCANKADAAQVREVEGQGWRCHAELLTDGTGVHPVRPGLDQRAEDRQTGFMTESGEQFGGIERFHESNAIEMSARTKPPRRAGKECSILRTANCPGASIGRRQPLLCRA